MSTEPKGLTFEELKALPKSHLKKKYVAISSSDISADDRRKCLMICPVVRTGRVTESFLETPYGLFVLSKDLCIGCGICAKISDVKMYDVEDL